MDFFTRPKLHAPPDNSVVFVQLKTNVPLDLVGVFFFLEPSGVNRVFSVVRAPGRDYLSLPVNKIDTPHKVTFMPFNGSGVWFNDSFAYTEGVTELTLTEPPGVELAPTHQVSGVCQRDGAPYAGEVHIVSAFDRAHLATVTAHPGTGEWLAQVATAGEVYAFLAAPHGRPFSPGLAVLAGEIIHPSAANGYTYEVTQAGTLGDTEPTTWPIDAALPSGDARLDPKAYPAPVIQGPLIPIII